MTVALKASGFLQVAIGRHIIFPHKTVHPRLEHPLTNNGLHAWSPDGTSLAVAGEYGDGDGDNLEIFIVDLQGKTKQLTNLIQAYDTASINSLSWSPDGRYLAFWLQNRTSPEDTTPFRLHILDTHTLETRDTCLLGGVGGPLAWSPDSKQIAFERGYWMAPHRLAMLDLDTNQAYQISPESVSLIGWVVWEYVR